MGGRLRTLGDVSITLMFLFVVRLAAGVPLLTRPTTGPDVTPLTRHPPTYPPKNVSSTFLPNPFTPPRSTPRPHCRDPEECCVHPFDSQEFDSCCEEHGCCPMECPTTLPGGSIYPTKDCDAWECCVYHEGSQRRHECCKHYGCCPLCEKVSSGCCYNDVMYTFRSVVLDLPEVCLQLVCAAQLITVPPFLAAVITPVKTCSFPESSEICVACPIHHCVDDTGILHSHGNTWSPSRCLRCKCYLGRFTCLNMLQHCQPPPHPGCISIPALPGQCCPTYHCDNGCIDDTGIFRPLNTQWPSQNPCVLFVCTETGVDKVNLACKPLPQPHEGCFLEHVQGECCPIWNCSYCEDTDGSLHPLNDQWQSDTCNVKVCTSTGITSKDIPCIPLGPPPHKTCYRSLMQGGCCEEWKCDGCWEKDVLHALGDVWPSNDPCVNNICTHFGAKQRGVNCPDFPRPHESCFEYTPEGACCQTWNCSGCLDFDGTYHSQFEEWLTDHCTLNVCHLDGITRIPVPCEPLGSPPHTSCRKVPTDEGCCEKWKCDGCLDNNGIFRPLNSHWQLNENNPCMMVFCTETGLKEELFICVPTPPLHTDCFLQSIKGECCRKWNCSGCLDANGIYHPRFQTWKTDPCTSHTCTENGINTAQAQCLPPPQPHPSCKLVSLPDFCCKIWRCDYQTTTDCYLEGTYPHGAKWQAKDHCLLHHCMYGTIATHNMECQENPPSANCFKKVHPGDCCPTWNCSGCLDASGNFHKLSERWNTTPCTISSCHESGITQVDLSCPDLPLPQQGCQIETNPGECCPTIQCSGCIDQHGELRQDGEEWPSNEPCLVFRCEGSKVKPTLIHCQESLPPYPNCFKYIKEGQCCPTWNCSGCLGDAGDHHLDGESWTSMCINHTCTQHGIASAAVHCQPAPDPRCIKEISPTDVCCPTWRCEENVTNCAAVLCEGPKHEDCTSYTPPGQCCPVFDCRPQKPDCTSVKCRKRISDNHTHCTAYTPPGYCCPIYTCRPIPASPTTRAATFCTDEQGNTRKNNEVWEVPNDTCRRAQCHKGVVIHHYLC